MFNKADLKTILVKRFVNTQLLNCGKAEVLKLVRCQSRDQRSTYGKNCSLPRKFTGELSEPSQTPVGNEWREGPLKELLSVRQQPPYMIPGFNWAECDAILTEICANLRISLYL